MGHDDTVTLRFLQTAPCSPTDTRLPRRQPRRRAQALGAAAGAALRTERTNPTAIDTHAGRRLLAAGRYAQKKGEASTASRACGTRRPARAAGRLRGARARVQPRRRALEQYPGSPAFARMVMRPGDPLCLFELHPTEHRILESHRAGSATSTCATPTARRPEEPAAAARRGAVLIDPSHEGHGDYARVVFTLRDALARFAEGVYMVWYPQVQKVEAAELPRRLEALAPKGWLHARLTVARADAIGASAWPAAACSSSTHPHAARHAGQRAALVGERAGAGGGCELPDRSGG